MMTEKNKINLEPIAHAVCKMCASSDACLQADGSCLPNEDHALRKLYASLKGADVLRLLDVTLQQFYAVLNFAHEQKTRRKDVASMQNAQSVQSAQGKSVAIIMEKPSLRTRVSFELAAAHLGAHPVVLADENSAFSRGETIQDTTLVLERFVDCIVLRTFEQVKLEEVAEWAHIPVVNALSDDFHPCQGLADALTILEHKGKLSHLKLAYVGDGSNNMAHTYLELGALSGMNISIAAPKGYMPKEWIFDECLERAKVSGAKLQLHTDPKEALLDADVVITDTWTSMGDEEEHDKRLSIFKSYQINAQTMKYAAEDAIFMHCLPAHRGEEVSDEVMDSEQSVIYDEAENRLHAQQALLSLLLGAY